MKVIGISPLDKDSTVTLVEDGTIVYAAAEERFTRNKLQDGFPWQALQDCLDRTGTDVADVATVAYPFLPWDEETRLFTQRLDDEKAYLEQQDSVQTTRLMKDAEARVPARTAPIPGLQDPNEKMDKGLAKTLAYRVLAGDSVISRNVAKRGSDQWGRDASNFHKKFHEELENALADLGLSGKLKRWEHHLTHAANAYYGSGFDEALIVSLDGYGSGLAGSASIGRGGRIERLHGIPYPHSLGTFYESVTSGLGFRPSRHEGKIVGLAAYGDPTVLRDVLLARIERQPGSYRILESNNMYFARLLASQFPKIDVAAAYQHVLEVVATEYVAYHLRKTGAKNVVLSGGVVANVKLNQRIFAIEGVEGIFVHPNMGDGGCGTGAALLEFQGHPQIMAPIPNVYLGPSYTGDDIEAALQRSHLAYDRYRPIEPKIAQLIAAGKVVARFDGRMEYGPTTPASPR
jgi:carbamoyltransferase